LTTSDSKTSQTPTDSSSVANFPNQIPPAHVTTNQQTEIRPILSPTASVVLQTVQPSASEEVMALLDKNTRLLQDGILLLQNIPTPSSTTLLPNNPIISNPYPQGSGKESFQHPLGTGSFLSTNKVPQQPLPITTSVSQQTVLQNVPQHTVSQPTQAIGGSATTMSTIPSKVVPKKLTTISPSGSTSFPYIGTASQQLPVLPSSTTQNAIPKLNQQREHLLGRPPLATNQSVLPKSKKNGTQVRTATKANPGYVTPQQLQQIQQMQQMIIRFSQHAQPSQNPSNLSNSTSTPPVVAQIGQSFSSAPSVSPVGPFFGHSSSSPGMQPINTAFGVQRTVRPLMIPQQMQLHQQQLQQQQQQQQQQQYHVQHQILPQQHVLPGSSSPNMLSPINMSLHASIPTSIPSTSTFINPSNPATPYSEAPPNTPPDLQNIDLCFCCGESGHASTSCPKLQSAPEDCMLSVQAFFQLQQMTPQQFNFLMTVVQRALGVYRQQKMSEVLERTRRKVSGIPAPNNTQ
jgi:hypothetical protein